MKTIIGVLVLCSLFVAAGAQENSTRQVIFRIEAREQPGPGEALYVSGGHPSLGSWKADGLALTPGSNNVWTGVADVPGATAIEFKVTKGSWETERLLVDGSVPDNETIPPGGDTTIELVAHRWKKAGPPPPPTITGNFRIHDAVHSVFLGPDRKVIVWLPPSYETEPERRYPVLYMHDGQQVFDPNTSTHGVDWGVDEWCTKLISEGKIKEIIVVGAYCTADRSAEYNPGSGGTNYARFLIEELKPMIDREYRTQPGRESTAVAGSSMGGKISFFLAWTHPDIFSKAACLSPAFRYKDDAPEIQMVRATDSLPDLKLYLFCGEGDDLEKRLVAGMREMDQLLREEGFPPEQMKTVEDEAAVHNEAAWQRVTGEWLRFFFGKEH